jgi:hypothetical protein
MSCQSLSALASLALTAALTAQTPPCISLNDANNTVGTSITAFGFAGPGVLGYRFTPAASQLLMAAELFTGNASLNNQGYMTLEVWEEDVVTGLPLTRLAGGTWQIQQSLGIDWQGASFDQVAQLNGGQNYWLVWRESGGNRLPYEPGGTTTQVVRFTGGNWVLQATAQPVKWRGYCSLLDAQNVQPVGFGCQAASGRLPASFANQAPTIGNANFQIEATGLPTGTVALAILGINAAWQSLPIPGAPTGCELHTDPVVASVVPVGTGNQQAQHAIGASGHAWVDIAIPADPTLVGFVIGAQFAALDAGSAASLPFVFSNGVRVTLF